jgi:hypothetical protein
MHESRNSGRINEESGINVYNTHHPRELEELLKGSNKGPRSGKCCGRTQQIVSLFEDAVDTILSQ